MIQLYLFYRPSSATDYCCNFSCQYCSGYCNKIKWTSIVETNTLRSIFRKKKKITNRTRGNNSLPLGGFVEMRQFYRCLHGQFHNGKQSVFHLINVNNKKKNVRNWCIKGKMYKGFCSDNYGTIRRAGVHCFKVLLKSVDKDVVLCIHGAFCCCYTTAYCWYSSSRILK